MEKKCPTIQAVLIQAVISFLHKVMRCQHFLQSAVAIEIDHWLRVYLSHYVSMCAVSVCTEGFSDLQQLDIYRSQSVMMR